MAIIKNVMEMTWVDLDKLDKAKTVLFATVAPIEEHSHHLPLGTDIYEGEQWRADATALLVEKLPEYNFLHLPPLPIACAGVTALHGNIYFAQLTVRNVLCELLESLAAWGISNIVVIASHADPRHLIAVEEACSEINKRHGIRAFSPMGAIFSAPELGIDTNRPEEVSRMIELYPNDFHAGWIETSNMLDIDSSIVSNEYRNLPDALIEAKDWSSPDRVLAEMSKYGHLGYPRLGNKELGALLNQNVAQLLAEAVMAFIGRKDYEKYEHHFLFTNPFFRTDLSDVSE